MKKRLWSIGMALVLLVGTLTGCSGAPSDSAGAGS